jgi:hypothetical protein
MNFVLYESHKVILLINTDSIILYKLQVKIASNVMIFSFCYRSASLFASSEHILLFEKNNIPLYLEN